ncbi:helix-turn-helix domain-containing protein [Cochleicola gelatinilyticus]|uniref:HTH araC/xylS-type domain-containing protein n=1 Tax=Cochleicola gelatinilyticus TaxID=1763537 RepID=A0A167IYV7_9FLAO|nr:helix-turn-helix domain-containing protein [Cochleicola gelatinilyticus]OAB80149.1 hypothetical protein ULVI_05270 [Cochleicola gelatinilyticus]
MKYVLLLFFVFTSIIFSYSQSDDALSQMSFDALRDTIITYEYRSQDKVITTAKAYILKAEREHNKTEQWFGMEFIGEAYYHYKLYEKANDQGEDMLAFARKNLLSELEMRSLGFLGDVQLVATTAENALLYYEEQLSLAETKNNERYQLVAINKIANVYSLIGDEEKAIAVRKRGVTYYENKPIDSSHTIKDKNGTLAYIYNVMGNSHLKLKQIDSAKLYSGYIKKFPKEALDSCYVEYYYILDAEIAYEEKRFNDAKNFFTKLYSVCPDYHNNYPISKAYSFGKIEVATKNYHEAIRILQQGLDNYQVLESEEGFMNDYYKMLAEAYMNTGDFERASYYFEKQFTSQKEFSKFKNDAKNKFLRNEREEFENEFNTLYAEKEKKQNHLNYLLLGGSLIILALLFFLLKFYREKKKNEAKFKALVQKIKVAEEPKDIIDTKDAVLEEANTTDVPEETKQQILEGLKKLEEKEYYLKQECNSYHVAKKLGTNTSYLSKVINSHFGKNFNTYINDLRINYAIVRLKDDVIFRSYSIQSIAEELGYKSADSFTKYFKKDTGLNPSFYIKEIKNIT